MDGPAALVLRPLRMSLAPHFLPPWESRSLADFWGLRWNMAASNALRTAIYEPLVQGSLVKQEVKQSHQQQAKQGGAAPSGGARRRSARLAEGEAAAAAAGIAAAAAGFTGRREHHGLCCRCLMNCMEGNQPPNQDPVVVGLREQ